jgi:hypothetical protein
MPGAWAPARGEGKRLLALVRQGGRQRWVSQRARLRHPIRAARLPPYGEGRGGAGKRGETLAALLERPEELGMAV